MSMDYLLLVQYVRTENLAHRKGFPKVHIALQDES
jgi:hypothetical protein